MRHNNHNNDNNNALAPSSVTVMMRWCGRAAKTLNLGLRGCLDKFQFKAKTFMSGFLRAPFNCITVVSAEIYPFIHNFTDADLISRSQQHQTAESESCVSQEVLILLSLNCICCMHREDHMHNVT